MEILDLDKENSEFDDKSDSGKDTMFTRGYNMGRWTKTEHQKFLKGLQKYGKEWKRVQRFVGTRSSTQARSHAQKFFSKLEKKNLILEEVLSSANTKNSSEEPDESLPSPLSSEPVFFIHKRTRDGEWKQLPSSPYKKSALITPDRITVPHLVEEKESKKQRKRFWSQLDAETSKFRSPSGKIPFPPTMKDKWVEEERAPLQCMNHGRHTDRFFHQDCLRRVIQCSCSACLYRNHDYRAQYPQRCFCEERYPHHPPQYMIYQHEHHYPTPIECSCFCQRQCHVPPPHSCHARPFCSHPFNPINHSQIPGTTSSALESTYYPQQSSDSFIDTIFSATSESEFEMPFDEKHNNELSINPLVLMDEANSTFIPLDNNQITDYLSME